MMRLRIFLLASLAGVLACPPAARAACQFDGTVPDTDASVIVVSGAGKTFYVDDRDLADVDADGLGGGIRIYEEANGVEGLQRGGRNWGYTRVETITGKLPPVPYPCDLNPPGGPPIFPQPMCIEMTLESVLTPPDSCQESANPDRLLF